MSIASFDLRLSILDYTRRNFVTLPELVARQPFATSLGNKAVRILLQRLCHQERLLSQAPFDGRNYYYYLSPRGARLLGDGSARTSPLPEREKLRAYAAAAFCASGPEARLRLDRHELQRLRKTDESDQANHYYVVKAAATSHLGYLRVDLGGNGRWDRVIHQSRRDIHKHIEHPVFSQWIAAGKFEFALITPTDIKAARIRRGLAEISIKHSLAVRVFSLPRLLPLLFPLPEPPP